LAFLFPIVIIELLAAAVDFDFLLCPSSCRSLFIQVIGVLGTLILNLAIAGI
jgi:hypothetical protein